MDRINRIISHPVYKSQFDLLQEAEQSRSFCNHTMEHFLDVARLMYIKALEANLLDDKSLTKELIYATALMHDIGRIDQIKEGIPHEEAGYMYCRSILPECGFAEEEIQAITFAIAHHRKKDKSSETRITSLNELLYWADKKSRCCFKCEAFEACNWSEEIKNTRIEY